jgi:hypothetical protein
MRIATMLAVAALAGIAWAGACLAIGLPTGLTIAGAVLGAAGGFMAAAMCAMGAGADALEHEASREPIVALVRDERFSREEAPSPTKDRVA